jgi:hypothetical protein
MSQPLPKPYSHSTWNNNSGHSKPADALDEKQRLEIIRRAATSTAKDPSRPMSWVIDSWQPAEEYETVHSAFWRTIKKVVHEFRIPDADTDFWADHLLWSDLYKISPEAGHNPPDPLCAIQEPRCIEMLSEEIAHWQPRRIVFFTGESWEKPFLEKLGATSTISKQGHFERSGRLSIPAVGEGIPYVVGPQPDRRGQVRRPPRRHADPGVPAVGKSLSV